ncbi:YolD-like family protein [Lysinibacillus xylanilyticus]|uniref:YolD-like family protein n=1 Tax=Lysinibacillus xylanilyticus TaxID=582475 RepID=UPI0036DD6DA1
MIQDRGNMKWTSLMLPEHLVEIRKWKEEQFHEKKRELSEWELEEIEQTIQRAFKMKEQVKLMLWSDNKLLDVVGFVTGVDVFKKELLLETDTSIKHIVFDHIQNASLVNSDD